MTAPFARIAGAAGGLLLLGGALLLWERYGLAIALADIALFCAPF